MTSPGSPKCQASRGVCVPWLRISGQKHEYWYQRRNNSRKAGSSTPRGNSPPRPRTRNPPLSVVQYGMPARQKFSPLTTWLARVCHDAAISPDHVAAP